VPQGTYTYTYQAGTGHLASVSDPDGGALAFTYDGSLLTGTTWSGAVSGSIGLTYNNNFELTRRTVDGANPVAFTYDGEGLLQQAGALTLSRNAQTGLVSGTTLGNATDATTYNSFGEVQGYTARYGGTGLFGETFNPRRPRPDPREGRDDRWRQLDLRLHLRPGRTPDRRQEGQRLLRALRLRRQQQPDRLDRSSGLRHRHLRRPGPPAHLHSYTYSANGELATKSGNGQTIHYTYDVAGNLRTVLFPDSLQIDYVIDAANRRVGKKVNGVLVQGYLYKDGLSPVAELDGAGNVTTLFVYGSRLTVPAYMVQDGVTYRLFTDHLGSVRLVVNTADGLIAQRIDYDAFGCVILDTNPGLQPFGFAGGLYDSQTGLIRFGARDYDPETGRWTSKDPAGFSGGDTNLYGYVVNDPRQQLRPQRSLRLGRFATRCREPGSRFRRHHHPRRHQEGPPVGRDRQHHSAVLGGIWCWAGWRRSMADSRCR
jgi:RHS repeat-associated protein